jgi:hypothetical protein
MGGNSMRNIAKLLVGLCTCTALNGITWRAEATSFLQTNLVSDIPGLATITDPLLKNAWGFRIPPQARFGPQTRALTVQLFML